MRRTQIYLTDREHEMLQRRSRATGKTMSQLIREAIDRVHLSGSLPDSMSLEEKLRVIRETAGAWKDRDETGEEYVERIRSADRLRLARLHDLPE